jgi:hypothetical protein
MCVQPRWTRCAVASAVLIAVPGLLIGCGAAGPEPSPSAISSTAKPSPTITPSIPANGVTLGELGFSNGPLDTFSIPTSAVVTDRVDQPNAVTIVMSAPRPAALADYYRRALPAGGFTITADDPATSTLTFAGQGWTGALTGSGDATAVSLRPG